MFVFHPFLPLNARVRFPPISAAKSLESAFDPVRTLTPCDPQLDCVALNPASPLQVIVHSCVELTPINRTRWSALRHELGEEHGYSLSRWINGQKRAA